MREMRPFETTKRRPLGEPRGAMEKHLPITAGSSLNVPTAAVFACCNVIPTQIGPKLLIESVDAESHSDGECGSCVVGRYLKLLGDIANTKEDHEVLQAVRAARQQLQECIAARWREDAASRFGEPESEVDFVIGLGDTPLNVRARRRIRR